MKKQYIYAFVSIFLWSTTATVTKLLLGNLNSMQILLIGSLFAFIFLFIINLIKGNFKDLKQMVNMIKEKLITNIKLNLKHKRLYTFFLFF